MSDFFSDLLGKIDNDYASIAEDGVVTGDILNYCDTGSYTLNALLSGSINLGIPDNRVVALAGEPSTGKTFYAISICQKFLEQNPGGMVVYFESESAISKAMLKDRNVDTRRFAIVPVETVQQFRHEAMVLIEEYLSRSKKEREEHPLFFVLDSLGNLSTEKEITDIKDGKDTRDMTRAQLLKGAFRALTLKLAKAHIPMLVTNHVYDVVGSYVPVKKMNGGSGLEYAASIIIYLSKKKDKQGRGAIITATVKKSRITIENFKVETLLNYRTGLDPYFGLLTLAEEAGIVKKVSTRYEFPGGEKAFEKHIENEPEKYFTPEILQQIDAYARKYAYGEGAEAPVTTEDEENDTGD